MFPENVAHALSMIVKLWDFCETIFQNVQLDLNHTYY